MRYLTILIFPLLLSCASSNNYSYISEDSPEIERGQIELYPSRLSEIPYGEDLLDIESLLEPEFIYNYISSSRQSTSTNIRNRQFGGSIEVNEFLIQEVSETINSVLSSDVSEELQRQLTNELISSISNSEGLTSTQDSIIQSFLESNNLSSNSSSQDSNSITRTSSYNDSPSSNLSRIPLNSPSASGGLNLSYREVLYQVANAQLGGKALMRRFAYDDLASNTHKLFVLPIDVHFNPGTITKLNYSGKAIFELSLPNSLEDVNIIAATPMGYSKIVSDFSSTIRDLYLSAAGGLGLSTVLLEGKLESVIQDIASLESIFTNPEFSAVITDKNTVEFNYYGSKSLEDSDHLKPQTYHIELIILVKGYKNEFDINNESLSGFQILQMFRNQSFDAGVSQYETLSQSLLYSVKSMFLPTKKLKKNKNRFRTSGENYSKYDYSFSPDSGTILTNRFIGDFKKIDVTSASIFEQRDERCRDSKFCGFLVFKGTGFDTHKLIREYFFENFSNGYDLKEYSRDLPKGDTSETRQPDYPTNFVFSASTLNGHRIIEEREPVVDWTGENFVSIFFSSEEALKPGDEINVLLRVRENILESKDSTSVSNTKDTSLVALPQETILLYKSIKITGKAQPVNDVKKGIDNFAYQVSILERKKVGIELGYTLKGYSDIQFYVNDQKLEPIIVDSAIQNEKTPNEYTSYKVVLYVTLGSDDQSLEEIRNNNYHLVIRDDKDDVIFTKFMH